MPQYVTKEKAADIMGVSTRQIERLAAEGRIRTNKTRLPGDRSDRTVYDEADLAKPEPAELASRTAQPNLVQKFLEAAEARITNPPREPRAWMTIAEAAEYSGLTPAMLEQEIRDGLIYAMGRGPQTWRIQRSSLDRFGTASH